MDLWITEKLSGHVESFGVHDSTPVHMRGSTVLCITSVLRAFLPYSASNVVGASSALRRWSVARVDANGMHLYGLPPFIQLHTESR